MDWYVIVVGCLLSGALIGFTGGVLGIGGGLLAIPLLGLILGIAMALGSILCVPYGVKLAYAMPEPRLKLVFSCMLLVIMVLLLIKA